MIGKVAIATALRGFNDRTFGDPYIFLPAWGIESCPFATASRVKRWFAKFELVL